LCAAVHLLASDFDGLVVTVFLDQLAELRTSGDVGALADVDEIGQRRDLQRFEAAEPGMARQDAHAACSSRGCWRGACACTAAAIASICAGVVPQQPPTRLSSPARAKSPSTRAMSSGVSSYPPNALGRPALGWVLT